MPKRAKILIVDDERSIREMLEIFLKKEGFQVASASSAEEGLARVKGADFDLIISDIKMADMSGIDLLRELRHNNFGGQFILLTAFASTETAIQALKMGAFDYILKTENLIDELKLVVYGALENRRLREENTYLRREFRKVHGMGNLIGKSKKMQELFKMIEVVSATNSTVLITGESGTGKELVAKAIHLNSPRADESFVSVNCGAFTETLLESELFGYMEGAFTGAAANKKGRFEVADKGTIFLDE
ncbi:MAG: sigma-54-dependent Fis family transcriptional regulator, partial [Acidobacteria bacterium]|nr:sigma-54-dependent Fis family transcriptional regulator [Acidobacteriota bacterium]